MLKWSDDNLIDLNAGTIMNTYGKINNRETYLKSANYKCEYCGGKYTKYLTVVTINEVIRVQCRFCFVLMHINSFFIKEFVLASSKLSQRDIVRKTVEYISKKNSIPYPHEIDQTAKIVKISKFELCNLLSYYGKIPDELQNYKIFVSQEFDAKFVPIINRITNNMFIADNDNQSNSEGEQEEITQTQTRAWLTNEEQTFLINFFSNKYPNQELKQEYVKEQKEYIQKLELNTKLQKILNTKIKI